VGAAGVITVDDSGGAMYTSIQAAIDDAGPGDEIHVDSGTYIENVNVDKQLTLIGEGADKVTVQAVSSDDHVFHVTANWVNISGFKVTGATDYYMSGIYLYSVNNCNISENTLSNNYHGIVLWYYSNNNMLQNNNASNNDNGIHLSHSSHNTLTNNIANSNNEWGIYLAESGDNTLINNRMSDNTYNFDVYVRNSIDYPQNIDTSNTVDEKPIYYWVDQQDKQIPNDAGFVGVVNSTNITVRDLVLTNNYKGVLFIYADNSSIENVTTLDNFNGIYMWRSSNNMLQNNNASNNYDGIHLSYSNGNTLTNNTANSNNGWGIGLLYSSNNNMLQSNAVSNNGIGIGIKQAYNNILYHNNLIHNTQYNAWDSFINNQWDSGIEGNYYSDYTGTDSNGDGIGDIPYPIPGGSSVDRYPLMAPYSPTPPPSGFTVGQGAPTPEIEQLFIEAYNRNGGVDVLGDPATEVHDAWGYLVQDFPGVPGIPGGVIMYNSIQGDAFYIHGAIWERYYTFVDKSELGPVASDEGEAAILPQGTTGRYTKFETGTIHWISDKDDENVGHSQRGESFVTYGELDALYTSMGGTYSDLGFPMMDQEERDGHGFCEFEGGSIAWDGNEYKFVLLSSSFLKPNYPSEVFTTGDLKYSILNTKGNGFTVKIYASVILPDNTIKYAYSDEWPSCFGISTTSLTCSLSPLLLSDVKRPLVEESIQIEDRDVVWNANEMTGDDPPGLYTWKVWYEDINNPGKILASSTASYIVSYSRPEILRLSIKEETNNEFQVSVDGQEYTVATLNHYINPQSLKISETNDEVKVYLDMDGNPVADGEISRKIGVVDYVHKLQKNGLKDQLSQKQDDALFKVKYTGTLPLTDWTVDTLETLIQLPTKSIEELIKTFLEESATFVGSTIFNNKEELNEAAIEDFLGAHNNYFQSWNEIHNDEEVLDYEKANIVLQNYLLGDFNYGMGQFILDNYYKPKGELLVFEMREAAKIASLGTTEEIIAAAISVDYVTESFKEQSLTNCDISLKPYEFTSYTLQLAQSSPVSNNYDDCITNVEESTTQIKQEVSDFFTQKITLGIIHSPGELRIYDSQNRVTGLIDGQIIEDIPNSAYLSEDETVIIYNAKDTYRYEVKGTDFGTYGLDLISFINWDTISAFSAFDIPTSPSQNHQYDINWEMLFNSQNGVSIQIDSDGDGVFEQTIITGNTFYIYNITFLPPITTMDQFNLTDGSTLPIKFTVNHHITNEFIYDDTVNVTITNSTGHLITYFTNGTGTGSVRINSEEEQYIANFHTKDYAINIGETYSVTVTFGGPDSLRGYDITYFTLIEGGKAKGKGKGN